MNTDDSEWHQTLDIFFSLFNFTKLFFLRHLFKTIDIVSDSIRLLEPSKTHECKKTVQLKNYLKSIMIIENSKLQSQTDVFIF